MAKPKELICFRCHSLRPLSQLWLSWSRWNTCLKVRCFQEP